MFNKEVLYDMWIDAAEAKKTYDRCQSIIERVECGHQGRKMTKAGKPDKRYSCAECESNFYSACDEANVIYFKWNQLWDMFAKIEMPVEKMAGV